METYNVKLYTEGDELPEISTGNFFHSPELFDIIARTPGQRPYMAVATTADGREAGHLLALVRRRGSWFPPHVYTQGRVYGEGAYADNADHEAVFALLLKALTRHLRHRLCLYVEFSDLSRKMFGYRIFRENGYFPVGWQEVHNSLHSMPPAERLTGKMRERIDRITKQGVAFREAVTEDEVYEFYGLLNGFYRLKLRRLIPPEEQVGELFHSSNGRVFITSYNGKLIGGCLCVFSQGNAYLWYLAAKRKRHPLLHPDLMTVWGAIDWAWKHNYAHIYFLDVGLPTPHNPFRDFILSFGGKPVSKYRWFRFNIPWVNSLLERLYKE